MRRDLVLVIVTAILTLLQLNEGRGAARFLGLSEDPAGWAPIPFVVPAVLAVLPDRRITWAGAGAIYGIVAAAAWTGALSEVLLAAVLMPLGALFGRRIADVVRQPQVGAVRLVLVLAIALPVLTGAVDLVLRARTP